MKRIEIPQIRKGDRLKINSSGARLFEMIKIALPSRSYEFDTETSIPSLLFVRYDHRSAIKMELSQFPALAKQLVFSREGHGDMREINDNFDVPLSISTGGEVMITKLLDFPNLKFIERGYAVGMDFQSEQRYQTIKQFLEKYITSVPEIIRDIETTSYQFRFPGVQKSMILEMLAGKDTFATWIQTITGKVEKQLCEKFNAPVTLKVALHEQVLTFDTAEKLKTDAEFTNVINSNQPFALHAIVYGNSNPLNWFRITILPRPQQQLFKPESEYPLLIVDYSPNATDPDFNATAESFTRELEMIFNLASFDEKAIFPQFTEEDVM